MPARYGLPLLYPALLCLLLAGCAIRRDEMGFSGRCAAFMQRAALAGDITVTKEHAFDDTAQNFDTFVAEVQGVSDDMRSRRGAAHGVAGRCRFDEGVLTRFRWTVSPLEKTESRATRG
jgi:hypothetical protein